MHGDDGDLVEGEVVVGMEVCTGGVMTMVLRDA